VRGEEPFRGREPHYHAIPATTPVKDLLCSHISINFDRTGLQEDWNVAFPIDRLRELATEGTIGSMADTHYSFKWSGRRENRSDRRQILDRPELRGAHGIRIGN
jgi:hypothetical protein